GAGRRLTAVRRANPLDAVGVRAARLSGRAFVRATSTAVDVGLVAVLDVIAATGNDARAVRAHAARAVVFRRACFVDWTLVAEVAAAIDVRFLAVFDIVVAGGSRAVDARIAA